MDIRKIKNLIELIDCSSIAEIEIKEGEESVRITRLNAQVTAAAMPVQTAWVNQAVSANAPLAVAEEVEAMPAHRGHVIKSPMVGTFYRAASPGSRPFVEVGQMVTAGETVCVIEAMKMFNPIEADVSGKVVEVLVENGQPIEYDQPILIVE